MHNAENERIKRAYLIYLKEARRLGEHSIDAAAAALAKFEDYTKYRDFKRFHIQQAIGFKRKLSEQVSRQTGERLSRGTVHSTLNALRGFFQWLAMQPGYRSHLTYADAEYFSLPEKEARIAKTTFERPVPTSSRSCTCSGGMPAGSGCRLAQSCRDRLHAAHRRPRWRDGLAEAQARRPRRGHGRAGRARGAHEVLEDLHNLVLPVWRWGASDRRRLGVLPRDGEAVWSRRSTVSSNPGGTGPRSPVPGRRAVPRTLVERHAHPVDLQGGVRSAPACPTPTRIPSARRWPSSVNVVCHTPEEFKAWSQNLGHEQVMTTFSSYGHVATDRQAELIRRLGQRRETGCLPRL